jgi:hypothetical protein
MLTRTAIARNKRDIPNVRRIPLLWDFGIAMPLREIRLKLSIFLFQNIDHAGIGIFIGTGVVVG